MEMIPRSPTTVPYGSNRSALSHVLARLYQVGMIVCVNSYDVSRMLQNDDTAVSPWPPITENDLTIRSRLDERAPRCNNINAIVPACRILFKTTRHPPL